MSWEDVEKATVDPHKAKKANDDRRERQAELAKAYSRCFSSPDGQKVIADLSERFIINNATPLTAHNVNYEAAYHNGEAEVVRFIIHQLRQAEIL